MSKTKKKGRPRSSVRPSKLAAVKEKVASKKTVAKVAKAVATAKNADEERIEGSPVQRIEASTRAAACHDEIKRVLARFRCRLVPVINPPEPIGTEPVSGIIVRASYGILPEV